MLTFRPQCRSRISHFLFVGLQASNPSIYRLDTSITEQNIEFHCSNRQISWEMLEMETRELRELSPDKNWGREQGEQGSDIRFWGFLSN